MIIKSVYLQNFKGIKEKTIIDFCEDTTLLIGPNGFGKTTIFDALELAFTGKIYRTEQKKVTNDINDYKKPFFQNTSTEDVIIKVWLKDEHGKNLIIVKYYDKNTGVNRRGRAKLNKPQDFSILETYRDCPENFNADHFEGNKSNELTPREINEFLNIDNGQFEISEIYKLFNYLQQEETTFFLKKSEHDRRETLGFLFQTTQQENKLLKLNNYMAKLNKYKVDIKNKQKEYDDSNVFEKQEYLRLFEYKNIDFDNKDILSHEADNQLRNKKEYFLGKIENLINFKSGFSVKEYDKKQKMHFVNKNILHREQFFNYIALSNFFDEKVSEQISSEFNYIQDKKFIEAYLLVNYFEKIDSYIKNFEMSKKYTDYLNYLRNNISEWDTEKFQEICEEICSDNKDELVYLLNEYTLSEKEVGSSDKTLQTIFASRKNLHNRFNENVDLKSSECPYCGYDWESHDKLELMFDETESRLRDLLDIQGQKNLVLKSNFEKKVYDYIEEKLNNKLQNLSLVDIDICNLIKIRLKQKIDISDLKKLIDLSDLKINFDIHQINISELTILTDEILENIQNNFLVTKELYKLITFTKNLTFEEELNFIKNQSQGILDIEKYKISIDPDKIQCDISILEEYREFFVADISRYKEEFNYNINKTDDPQNMYQEYFESNEHYFESLTLQDLHDKKKYVSYRFEKRTMEASSILSSRIRLIENMMVKLSCIRDLYSTEIGLYKTEMIKKIKMPFFLYTAKILQNYQQGMGIFLSIKNADGAIRFLTDPSTDHDAMHHLSSGQIAVISLAFTLSINRTYNVSNDLKFLIIDDPIQDMDSLNVVSFIELLRHEFSSGYQIIVSTHSDSSAAFMKYKFERNPKNEVKLIHVQNEFMR